MARTPKKVGQVALNVSGSVVTIATGAAIRTQITEIWLANTGASARTATLLAHGTGILAANTILPATALAVGEVKIISDCKIVLAPGETLRGYQNAGTDVTVTAYGIEEA